MLDVQPVEVTVNCAHGVSRGFFCHSANTQHFYFSQRSVPLCGPQEGAQRHLNYFSGSKLQSIALSAALSERKSRQHLRHGLFQHNRPTAFIAARVFQCLFLAMRRSQSICLPTTRSGVFMIISSIEDPVVFERIFDHLDQRAEKQPLALRLAVRAPPACSLDL